ncbi:spore germination protein KA [Paenibacillus sophorae]|uniref:Spore germination protein n=1 Tax=Paenibacillus sophorae TaxID=1333845 RepID=A0A1H8LLR1_9BACL|nr:spore germination protein [Paenibacillus sophorae]QWU17250.1 spore germination protein [Paenibacillus sophorae]SEO05726.1 spore germination protein KA [Paenibacillus sophorae]
MKLKFLSKRKPDFRPVQNSTLPFHPLEASLDANLAEIKRRIGHSADVVFRSLSNPSSDSPAMNFIYIDGLVNSDLVSQAVIQPLTDNPLLKEQRPEEAFLLIKEQILPVGGLQECKTVESLLGMLFEGNAIIMLDGSKVALAAGTSFWEKRSVNEPTSQGVIRGPKEGFTESLRTGTSMLRRRLKTADLRVEQYKIGRRTQTGVALVYLHGIASEQVLAEIRQRLDAIDTDSILESNYIEELIQDGHLTPFPTIMSTERPDAMAGGILEGQVGIIIDGTPFALLAPATFFSFFQSSEDYYQRFDISSFLRLIRYSAFFVSMLLPALYIAITTFHQEMLPTTLLISLAAQREGVPFPAFIEALLMELTFDVLREAGVRMPRAIGPAISIVGALVLGQAAVQAGLVSAAMVIVVSFTAISNFVIPSMAISNSTRLIRFMMMLFAGTLGMLGIMSFLMVLLIHMASLQSFGVPYLSPIAPMNPSYLKDIVIRVPLRNMKMRPSTYGSKEAPRQNLLPKEQQASGSQSEGQGSKNS